MGDDTYRFQYEVGDITIELESTDQEWIEKMYADVCGDEED